MTSDAQRKREHFLRYGAMSLSAPIRRKLYRKETPTDYSANSSEENCSALKISMTSNRLISAVATWHDIHASLMKLGLSSRNISSEKTIKSSSNSSTSPSSSSCSSLISDNSLNGSHSNDESLDDQKLLNCHSQLSISNLELRSSQLKEMFPGLSEHWRCLKFQFLLLTIVLSKIF